MACFDGVMQLIKFTEGLGDPTFSHFRTVSLSLSAVMIRMMNGSVHVLSKFVRSVCGRCAVGVRFGVWSVRLGSDEHKRLSTV